MSRIFISYSRHNLEIVTKLINDMQAVGIDTWHDQTLTGGQRWWDSILANIRECDLFIFALSPESWDSEACKSELSYVTKLGKPILPVLVSEGININLLSAPLNEIQVTDYRKGEKEAVFALVRSIYRAPQTRSLPDPLPTPPPVPISYLSTLKERIDSTEPLSSQNQITLLFELEEELRQGRSPIEIRDLLLRLKRRDDLLAKIATKIDTALKGLEDQVSHQHREDTERPNKETVDHQPDTQTKFCPQCGIKAETGQKFCGACGAALERPNNAKVQGQIMTSFIGEKVPEIAGSKSRRYICKPDETPRLITDIEAWLGSKGFDYQQITTENQSQLLQIKKRGGWRDFVGMSTSLNLVFHQSGDTLTVQIGAGKWIDKAVAGTVSLLLLWPLAITAGLGAWDQMKMPEKIFDYIGSRLISN